MEQCMLKKDEFIRFILEGQAVSEKTEKKSHQHEVAAGDLMDFGFEVPDSAASPQGETDTSFAQRLLEASAFGKPDYVQTTNLIRSTDSVARHLPQRAAYWPKTPSRPYQTLLFEADLRHRDLLAIPAFKSRKVRHLDMVEDALARMVSEALDGFQRGGDGVTADVRKGRKDETLCIVSIKDERELEPVRLVCFGTVNAKSGGLETFHLTERTRLWEPQMAKDHLGLLYERQFKKLGSVTWQEAFTTSEERKQAEKLLEVCSKTSPQKKEIEEHVITLLDTIAKGFGLRCKAGQSRRLQAFELPSDHDIGIDPEEMAQKHGGKNPFGGVTLRDEKSRLLGYIVYPLKKKEDAAELRSFLERNNRFHNVLVVFPDGEETTLELWQGTEQLTGKLRKGQGFRDAAEVVSLLSRFFVVSKAKVRNPKELAEELAYRARYLRRLALRELEAEKDDGPLRSLYKNFKQTLIHDQQEGEFADAFAQTLTYSLLTARWIGNDRLAETSERFTRQNAIKYLPPTGHFLGELFKTVLSVKLDEQRGRLLWLVDDIADLLDRVDVTFVFGLGDKDSDQATDPVIHFYEPFLAAYDSELRSKRGVFYTPQPVVSYIVRSVHELLQTEFGLADGLADTTTWGEMLQKHPNLKLPPLTDEPGEKRTISPDEPFVQILDPATGTATFLVEVIEVIHCTLSAKWQQQGFDDAQLHAAWNDYVPQRLLPRLHGFELMMAPYAVAHMKIGLKLAETGYRFGATERARIYLTNALEPWVKQLPLIGFNALANEAVAVNDIKRSKRFTVVIGNPPYSNFGQLNRNPFILGLLADYKRGLNERKINLDDDFIKFVRFAQWCVSTTQLGVFGFITNNIYLDGATHRQMRRCLTETYGKLRVIDLHGDGRKQQKGLGGIQDENVFDIIQGVAISLFTKSPGAQTPATLIETKDIIGPRSSLTAGKYEWLIGHSASTTDWAKVKISLPNHFFVKKELAFGEEYLSAPSINEVLSIMWSGIQTKRDSLTVEWSAEDAWEKVSRIVRMKPSELLHAFELPEDGRDWKADLAIQDLKQSGPDKKHIVEFAYRPLDTRFIYYTGNSKGWIAYPRNEASGHLLNTPNVALIVKRSRMINVDYFCHICVVDNPPDINYLADQTYFMPLYSAVDANDSLFGKTKQKPEADETRFHNVSPKVVGQLCDALNIPFVEDGSGELNGTFGPMDIFHYAYAVFHSPGYRNRYAEFLKIDFPRLPLTGSLKLFRALSKLGGELTALHLLESQKLGQLPASYIGTNNPEIVRIGWSDNTVWLDAPAAKKGQPQRPGSTGFREVPEAVWNFHIGGYQVCHKWLKDRKGRILSDDDIFHYQKIIVALSETIRLMAEIDKVIDEHGGWPGAFAIGKGGTA